MILCDKIRHLLVLLVIVGWINNGASQYLTNVFPLGKGTSERVLDIEIDEYSNRVLLGEFVDSIEIFPGVNLTADNNLPVSFLTKLDEQNNILWLLQAKRLLCKRSHMVLDNEGNVILAGVFYGTIQLGVDTLAVALNNTDYYVIKISSNGELKWCRSFGGEGNEDLTGLAVDKFGNVYTAGHYSGFGGIYADTSGVYLPLNGWANSFLHKLDENGHFIWAKRITGLSAQTQQIVIDDTGAIFSVGIFKGTTDFDPDTVNEYLEEQLPMSLVNGYLQKLSGAGDFEWVKNLGPFADYSDVLMRMNHNNELILSGRGGAHKALLKINQDGSLSTIRSISTSSAQISDMEFDEEGNVYIGGFFYDTLPLLYPDSISEMVCNVGNAGFLQKINAKGELIWAKKIKGDFVHDGVGNLAVRDDELVVCGVFSNNAIFDNEGNVSLSMMPYGLFVYDAFVATYKSHSCSSYDCDITIFPNPTNGIFTIKASQPFVYTDLYLIDYSGRILKTYKNINGTEFQADISDLSKGLYFVYTIIDREWKSFKVLKY